jgi:hypothetical protein
MITVARLPADRGQGRKPLPMGDGYTVVVHIRVTPAQRDKFNELGGGRWFRDRVERAKEPGNQA